MSLREAIELIANELPARAKDSVLKASSPGGSGCSGQGFGFLENRHPLDLKGILQRRLAIAEPVDLREWVEGQLDLIEALGKSGVLFQGYVVEGGYRYDFLIAPQLGRFVHYRSRVSDPSAVPPRGSSRDVSQGSGKTDCHKL